MNNASSYFKMKSSLPSPSSFRKRPILTSRRVPFSRSVSNVFEEIELDNARANIKFQCEISELFVLNFH